MFPAKVLADLSSVHGRPSKRPSSYEQHKANLKKLLRQRQKQMQERRNKLVTDIKSTTSPNKVRAYILKIVVYFDLSSSRNSSKFHLNTK